MLKHVRKNRAIAGLSLALLVLQMFAGLAPRTAEAASISSASDTVTRHKVSTAANHEISFDTPSGFDAGSETMTLTWVAGWNLGSVAFGDVDMFSDTTPGPTGVTIAATNGAGTWGFNVAGQVMTFTAPTDEDETTNDTVHAGDIITIYIGTNASGGSNQITNPGSAGSYEFAVAGTFGDEGEIDVPIMDDDQVTVTAEVDTFITFDLDVANGHANSDAPYAVDLGELIFSTYTDENTSGVDEIYVDVDTNAASGVVIEVMSAGGSQGLDSASASDNIPSVDGALQTGQTEGNYGIAAADLSGLTAHSNFSKAVGNVGDLSTSFQTVFSTLGPVAGGSGQVNVRAISGTLNAAADDYTDTLTFRATATF